MRRLTFLAVLSVFGVLSFAAAAGAQMVYPQDQMQAPAPSAPAATGQYVQEAPAPAAATATDQYVQAPAATGQGVTVSMEDNYFDQAEITVAPGTTVTWVQNGDNPHTTTSYDGLWDSGLIAGGSGGTFSFTFDEPGTYAYYCMPHESQGMVGTVTVTQQGAGAGGQQLALTGGPPLVVLPVALFLMVSGALIAVLRRVL